MSESKINKVRSNIAYVYEDARMLINAAKELGDKELVAKAEKVKESVLGVETYLNSKTEKPKV